MSHYDLDPANAAPTEELSRHALELLQAGNVGYEFADIAHGLYCSTGEAQASIEGTLLIVGADLEEIAQAALNGGEVISEHLSRERRMFAFLAFAEGRIDSPDRELRPVGREIVGHCLSLSQDPAFTEPLQRILLAGT